MKENLFHPSSRMEDDQEGEFASLFEKHSDELFRHAFLRLSDRDRALDVTQETFLRVLKYADKGEEIKNHRALLYRVLNNLIVDEYRKSKSQSLDALLENEDAALSVESQYLRDPLDMLVEALVRFDSSRVLQALKRLPEPYRAALVYRYINGLVPTEIAETTGESENVISVRIHRGLKRLKKMLEENI